MPPPLHPRSTPLLYLYNVQRFLWNTSTRLLDFSIRGVNTQRITITTRFSLYYTYTTVPIVQANYQLRASRIRVRTSEFRTLPLPREKECLRFKIKIVCVCVHTMWKSVCRNNTRCRMGVATDVSENYLDCLDVPAEYQPSTYVSDTSGDHFPVHWLFMSDLSICFCLFLYIFFFFLLFSTFFPDGDLYANLYRVRVTWKDCFLFRFDGNDENSFDFADRDVRRKMNTRFDICWNSIVNFQSWRILRSTNVFF